MEESDAIKESKEKKKKKTGVKKSESSKSSGRKSSSATVSDSNAAAPEMNGEVVSADATSEKRKSVAEAPGSAGPPKKTADPAKEAVPTMNGPQDTVAVNGEGKSAAVDAPGTEHQTSENSLVTQPNDSSVTNDVTDASPKDEMYKAPPQATKKDISLLKDIDDAKLLELKEAFTLFDLNQDGMIDLQDLKLTFISLGDTNITEESLYQMLREVPGPLDFDAFVVLLGYRTIELDPEEILLEALANWDYGNSGLIEEERLRHDLMMFGDKFSPKEVEVALEDAPVYINKKGIPMIDYIKFCSILCGLRKKHKSENA